MSFKLVQFLIATSLSYQTQQVVVFFLILFILSLLLVFLFFIFFLNCALFHLIHFVLEPPQDKVKADLIMAASIHFILDVCLCDKPVGNPVSLQAITFEFETFIDEVLKARIHVIFVLTVEFEKI